MKTFLAIASFLTVVSVSEQAFAGEKTQKMKQEAREAGNDTRRGMNRAGRKVQDATCEMINGKMECAGRRGMNAVKNGADKVEDAVD